VKFESSLFIPVMRNKAKKSEFKTDEFSKVQIFKKPPPTTHSPTERHFACVDP
jgi:hypothetical protein